MAPATGTETSDSAHRAPFAKMRDASIERLLEHRWVVVLIRAVFAAWGAVIGAAFAAQAPYWVTLSLLAALLVLFLAVEFLLVDTPARIRERATDAARDAAQAEIAAAQVAAQAEIDTVRAAARADAAAASTQADSVYIGEKFLVERAADLRQVAVAISSIHDASSRDAWVKDTLRTQQLIGEILKDLCNGLSAVTAKSREIALQDARFRATFMEVSGAPGSQRLVFRSWHTWDNSPPRSMMLGQTLGINEGAAGRAWETNRPVIQNTFRDGHAWKELYGGQSKMYKAMICLPVRKGYDADGANVIGVITVDTQIEHCFGAEENRSDEDKMAAIMQPYSTTISLVLAFAKGVQDLQF